MLKGLTHKKRFRLLLLLVAVSPFLVYWLAVSDTISAASQCISLERQYEQVGDLDNELLMLRQGLQMSNAALGMNEGKVGSFQTQLLNAVSAFCSEKELDVVGFSQPDSYSEGDLLVETIPVTVEGGFQNTLRLIQFLETEAKTGKLVSVSHRLTAQPRTRKKVLQTTIQVQNIIGAP